MQDKDEDNMIVGNMNFGSTGANNDETPSGDGFLESVVRSPKVGFSGLSDGQQQPANGKPGLGA